MKAFRISLNFPYPPPELLPNKKLHWKTKMQVTRQTRSDAYIIGLVQGGRKGDPLTRVGLAITWYPPSGHIADYDSLLRATKPIIDGGLVDAGFILDDSPKVIIGMRLYIASPDKANPRTEIIIIAQQYNQPPIHTRIDIVG